MASMSMAFFREVMALPLDPSDRNFDKVLRVKNQAAQGALMLLARVEPSHLRQAKDDGLADLLAALDAEDMGEPEPTLEDLMGAG